MEFFLDPAHDPAYNLALEELLTSEYEKEFFMLWRNGPSIIVGRNQNTLREIDADAVRALGIQVVRRTTGGGAVYHDLGNINYTIARDGRRFGAESFSEITGVFFKKLSLEVIAGYLQKVNVLDKAGAYAIQEHGDMLIETVSGSFSNVEGLPMERLTPLLARLFA